MNTLDVFIVRGHTYSKGHSVAVAINYQYDFNLAILATQKKGQKLANFLSTNIRNVCKELSQRFSEESLGGRNDLFLTICLNEGNKVAFEETKKEIKLRLSNVINEFSFFDCAVSGDSSRALKPTEKKSFDRFNNKELYV